MYFCSFAAESLPLVLFLGNAALVNQAEDHREGGEGEDAEAEFGVGPAVGAGHVGEKGEGGAANVLQVGDKFPDLTRDIN